MTEIKRLDEAQFHETLKKLLNSRERLTREQMAELFPEDGGLGSEMRAKLIQAGRVIDEPIPPLATAPPADAPGDPDKPRKRFNLFRR